MAIMIPNSIVDIMRQRNITAIIMPSGELLELYADRSTKHEDYIQEYNEKIWRIRFISIELFFHQLLIPTNACICTHICTHTHTHTHTHTSHLLTYSLTHSLTYACLLTCIHACTQIHTHTSMYAFLKAGYSTFTITMHPLN